jgi:hypothetical protein
MATKFHCRVLKSRPVYILNKMNPFHNFPSYPSTIHFNNVGFEVLTAMLMKSSIFWDITTYSPLEVNRLHRVISQKVEIFILILSSHLCLGLPNSLFPSTFPIKTLKTEFQQNEILWRYEMGVGRV